MDAISYKQKEYLYSYFRSKPLELNLHLHKYYEFLYFISGDKAYMVEDNHIKFTPAIFCLQDPENFIRFSFSQKKPYERIYADTSRLYPRI